MRFANLQVFRTIAGTLNELSDSSTIYDFVQRQNIHLTFHMQNARLRSLLVTLIAIALILRALLFAAVSYSCNIREVNGISLLYFLVCARETVFVKYCEDVSETNSRKRIEQY